MRNIKKLIIHCSDSEDSLDIGFRDINEWHRQRGWLSPTGVSCGYHFIIRRFGSIETGRTVDEVGAHCKGHNSDSIGICVVGRKKFDQVQIDVLMKLVNDLRTQYKIPIENVFGHYEFEPNKTCPNMDMVRLRAELLFHK